MGCGASTAAPPAGASTRAQGEEPYKVVDAPASGPPGETYPAPILPNAAEADSSFKPAAAKAPPAAAPVPAASAPQPAGDIQAVDHLAAEPPPSRVPDVYSGPDYAAPEHERSEELFEAVDSGDAESVQTILDEGVPPGVVDDDGNTPLHKAAEGETECAKVLLAVLDKATGVFEAKNSDGETPLMVAIKYEDAAVCTLFIEAGSLCTQEAFDKAREGAVPEVVTAVTGDAYVERAPVDRGDEAAGRRVSVSGGTVDEFTKTYTKEQGENVRRQSCMGGDAVSDAEKALAEFEAMGGKDPDDEDDEPPATGAA